MDITTIATAQLYTILARLFAVEPHRIDSDTLLFDELGADSLAMVELAELISDEFNIDLSGIHPDAFRTVGDVTTFLAEKLT